MADSLTCRWCGKGGQEVRHIRHRSEGGPDDVHNLIFLCNGCHVMVHTSKKVYRPLLLTYIWAFYVQERQFMVPEIASALRTSGELTELQVERLYGAEYAGS